jgi:hypothetical protein
MPSDDPTKKLIIDEDWKSQVQAEKAAAAAQSQQAEAPSDAQDAEQPPPPSLALLVTSLATQAMASMGAMPDPHTGQPTLNLEQAKYLIDTLAMLEEKTTGNRTPDESALLSDVLYQLRMLYVAMQKGGGRNPFVDQDQAET